MRFIHPAFLKRSGPANNRYKVGRYAAGPRGGRELIVRLCGMPRTNRSDDTTRRLKTYRAKRDFSRTPEPADVQAPVAAAPRFVIQEHHASHLHWDFRLERDGVLVSWALPKGVPLDPKKNHLAVHTEDHPLSYFDFAGTIPRGNYGAGEVYIWDHGHYDCHKFRDDEVMITLHGERVQGKYVLFRTHGKNWMIHRMDPAVRADPMPQDLTPMLARLSHLPRDDARYAFEIKWDGVRALSYIEGGRIQLQSRNLLDVTAVYPELKGLGEQAGSRRLVLDGEVVALDAEGRPSFQRLQNRMRVTTPALIRRRMQETPVVYMIFDVLYADGTDVRALAYTERRKRLEALKLAGPHWQTPGYHVGDGKQMLAASRARGLEGVIAKRLDSRYEAGARTGAWLKIKNVLRQEFVVAGFTPGARHPIGSLLLGYYAADGDTKSPRLRYAGGVGTGFTGAVLDELYAVLKKTLRPTNPFGVKIPKRDARFVSPTLVAEIEFTEWTRAGTLRHPSFKGLRSDKMPSEVVRET